MKVGYRIKALRENRHLSQDVFAKMIGESQKNISLLESNKMEITFDILNRIYKELKLSDEEYFELVKPESIIQNFHEKVSNGFINIQNNYEDKTFQVKLIEILDNISNTLNNLHKKM